MNARNGFRVGAAIALVLLLTAATGGPDEFEEALARVDKALRTNPKRVPMHLLESCESRRKGAIRLYDIGQTTRALRRLDFCKKLLGIADEPVKAVPSASEQAKAQGEAEREARQRAAREVEQALGLEPDLANGLRIYRDCAQCHGAEGWGLSNGSVPQLAGQHRTVIVKQLADIRAGNRDNPLMAPYATVESMGGAQGVADVAGYIDTLEISIDSDKGKGKDLALGKKLYEEKCVSCHGATGEGDGVRFMPRIHSQHYRYLVRQLEWIRDGKRRNGNAEMVAAVKDFGERETKAVADYVSRLEPPIELQAPPDWHNPDFAD